MSILIKSMMTGIMIDTDPDQEKGRRKARRNIKVDTLAVILLTLTQIPSVPMILLSLLPSWSSRRWRKKGESRKRKKGGRLMKHRRKNEKED